LIPFCLETMPAATRAPVFSPEATVCLLDATTTLSCHMDGDKATLQFGVNGAVVATPDAIVHLVMIPCATVTSAGRVVRVFRAFAGSPVVTLEFACSSQASKSQEYLMAARSRVIRSLYSSSPPPSREALSVARRPCNLRSDGFDTLLAASYAVLSHWMEWANGPGQDAPRSSLVWLELTSDGSDGSGTELPTVPLHIYKCCEPAPSTAHQPWMSINMPKLILASESGCQSDGENLVFSLDTPQGESYRVLSFFSEEQASMWQQLAGASYKIRESCAEQPELEDLMSRAAREAAQSAAGSLEPWCGKSIERPLLTQIADSDDEGEQ